MASEREIFDKVYSNPGAVWTKPEPPAELVGLLDCGAVKPCRVLDVGCGEGFNSIYKTAVPNPTDIIPYKMITGNMGGQENDALGASGPSREANSQTQENRIGLEESSAGGM